MSESSSRESLRSNQSHTRDGWIAVVSHELRTSLTSLHSALNILATGQLGTLSSEGQQMLCVASSSTERLMRLVNNLLDLERIESGNFELQCQTQDVVELMTQAIALMQPLAQQHDVNLKMQPQPLSVWADADAIVQVLTNLLSNAIKFSERGGTVWLSVEPIELAEPSLPNELIFHVRDQGHGIPTDQLEHVFERFRQVSVSDCREKGGTGLGLAICRSIIEQHNGKIWAESTLSNGSTFSFTLPTSSFK